MRVNRRGFSLLEVVVALTILAMVCTVAFRGVSVALRTLARVQQSQHRLELARSKLAELDLCSSIRAGDHAEGRFDEGTRWRVDTSSFIPPAENSSAEVVRITLRVEWDGETRVQRREIATYRFAVNSGRPGKSLEEQLRELR